MSELSCLKGPKWRFTGCVRAGLALNYLEEYIEQNSHAMENGVSYVLHL